MTLQFTSIMAVSLLLMGCTGLSAPQVATQKIYLLDAQPQIPAAATKRNIVLAVSAPQASLGYDTVQMAYVQQAHELNYFVTSRWSAAPARMLEPLLVQALERSGGFKSIVTTPDTIPGDIRLDTELLRLEQNFTIKPSRVRLVLRAQLVDLRANRILAIKYFDDTENSTQENAYGGVLASNQLTQRMLSRLAEFCLSEIPVR